MSLFKSHLFFNLPSFDFHPSVILNLSHVHRRLSSSVMWCELTRRTTPSIDLLTLPLSHFHSLKIPLPPSSPSLSLTHFCITSHYKLPFKHFLIEWTWKLRNEKTSKSLHVISHSLLKLSQPLIDLLAGNWCVREKEKETCTVSQPLIICKFYLRFQFVMYSCWSRVEMTKVTPKNACMYVTISVFFNVLLDTVLKIRDFFSQKNS